MFRAALLTACLALPAAADCVTKEDLATGISFTRKDGSTGHIVAVKGSTLQIEYVTNRDGWFDSRTTTDGIYETHFSSWLSDAVLVGSKPSVFDWRFTPKPPVPVAGTTWQAKVREVETRTGYGSEMVEMVDKRGRDLQASFTYLPEAEAKLSGCTYRILPVEATFTSKNGNHTRRWIYFPDLGFGLETIRDGERNGLNALTAD